ELAQKVRKDPPPSLRARRRDLPVKLEKIVLRALAKEREERWASAAEFAEALMAFGGRNISLDDAPPSDSFTMDLVEIRARETMRQRGTDPSQRKPAIEPPPEELELEIDVALEDDLRSLDTTKGAFGARPSRPARESLPLTRALES